MMGVPFSAPGAMHAEIRADLDRRWHEIVDDASFVGGAHVERFEQQWADYCGTREAVGVGNGTDALHLTLRALGVGTGDEVLVPANTFVATVEAVVLAGARPRFVDVEPESLLLTADHVAASITPRTAAVVVVHLYGSLPPMDPILTVAAKAGIAVVEDAAQAHGATWLGRRAGSFGVAGCFSFYPGKNLGAFGDAGAVTTDDTDLAGRVRSLANHGRAAGSHHLHPALGTNSRLDALQAAVLSTKLPRLDGWTRARRAAVDRYAKRLAGLPVEPITAPPGGESAHHLNVVRVRERDRVRTELDAHGIRTGLHYPVPCHRQHPYRRFPSEPLPVAEWAADEILTLPLFPHIADEQVAAVCDALGEAVTGRPLAHGG